MPHTKRCWILQAVLADEPSLPWAPRSVRSQRSLVPSASTWREFDLLFLNKATHQRPTTIGLKKKSNKMAMLIISSQQDCFFSLPVTNLTTMKRAKHIKDIHICISSTCHLKNVKKQGACFSTA